MKKIVLFLLLAIAGASVLFATFRDRLPDTHLSGAYRFPDGRILGVSPTGEDTWRVRDFSSGAVHTLYPEEEDRFTARPGWEADAPTDGMVRFTSNALFWKHGGQEEKAERLRFSEKTARFPSGNAELFGRLVLPVGKGPHPVVVQVHGSEKDAATAFSHEPWLLVPKGIAVLVFDKRGTGSSGGKFCMDFGQLADDVVAAVDWLKQQPEIDPHRIGLAGYSQGGWVSPLAASKSEAIKFVLVGFGMVDSPAEEDRKETLHSLRRAGFGGQDLGNANELIKAVHAIMRQRFAGGWEELGELKGRFADEPWVEALGDSTSHSAMRYPGWVLRVGGPWMMPRGLDRYWFYDSRPVLDKLDIPMLWLIGGDDIEAPNETTIAVLKQLAAKGKPFELVIYPGADHGIVLFEEKDGERVYTRYAPGYFPKKIDWIRRQVTGPRS